MPTFALNHMTVARQGFADALRIAMEAGCGGLELRNDLPRPLFDGLTAGEAGAQVCACGMRLLALAEVKAFNDWSEARAREAQKLIDTAREAGAGAVALIPRNDGRGLGNGERQANLRVALRELAPMLREAGLTGLVEPLGFDTCALRHKADAVDAITALGAADTFALVHDTFHHHLAGGGDVFPAVTGIVHISGVVDPVPAVSEMTDAHRVLVDGADRLGNFEQIEALMAGGYDGPLSFEAFSPEVHALADPVAALKTSMEFVTSRLPANAA